MTIYYDQMGHMVSDTSIEELHEFAKKLGLKRKWFQNHGNEKHWNPHYDLTTPRARKRAGEAGAVFVDAFEIPGILREAPYQSKRHEYLQSN